MNRRCPQNKLVGLGILRGWKWFIYNRGYANIIESPKDLVYGLVYEVSPTDEANLDKIEGVPRQIYTKYTKEIELQSGDHEEGSVVRALVYIDKNVEEGKTREEYIHRMNMGINDAAERGMPEWYIDKYLRKYIPAGGADEASKAPGPKE